MNSAAVHANPGTAAIKTDPIELEITRSALIAACREMGLAMMRTSFSPIFNESLDFSCCIFDATGEMVAQGDFCPAQIGAIVHTVEWCIKEINPATMRPGDVFLHNDPYRGGCHLPEHLVLKPCFVQDEIVAYTANIAHMVDVGGSVPGCFGDTRDIFQEGLRIPPVRIYQDDREVEDVFRLLISNVRTPQASYGDLKAMIGSLYVAERRIHELVDRHGTAGFAQCAEDIKDVSEALARQAIAEIPDGDYSFEGVIEDDGVEPDRSWVIKATVVVRGDEVIVDYTGSSPQCSGAANQTFGVTSSASYTALFNIYGVIPFNHGCYRPISIIAPPGSFVNVQYPGSCVGGNSDTSPNTTNILLGALAEHAGKGTADDGNTLGLLGLCGDDPRTGRSFTFLHFDGAGWGGYCTHDGNDVHGVKTGNCQNTPVEIMETRYPLLCTEYRLNTEPQGRPGAGQFRGGFGTRRVIRVLGDRLSVSAHSNRSAVRPWGKAGGDEGGNSEIRFRLAGTEEWRTASSLIGSPSIAKFSGVELHKGDEFLLAMPGGGGYGDPFDREPWRVEADVRAGYYTPEEAGALYGVILDAAGTVDAQATANAREAR